MTKKAHYLIFRLHKYWPHKIFFWQVHIHLDLVIYFINLGLPKCLWPQDAVCALYSVLVMHVVHWCYTCNTLMSNLSYMDVIPVVHWCHPILDTRISVLLRPLSVRHAHGTPHPTMGYDTLQKKWLKWLTLLLVVQSGWKLIKGADFSRS